MNRNKPSQQPRPGGPASAPPRASGKQVLKHYAASMAVYGSLLLLLTYNPWFSSGLLNVSFHGVTALQVYRWMFGAYAVLAPAIYFLVRPRSLWESKNLAIVGYLGRLVRLARGPRAAGGPGSWKPDEREGHALAFLLIKLMFGPLMLNAAMLELQKFKPLQALLKISTPGLHTIDLWFMVFVACIFLADATLFFIGYHTEAGFLRNRLRRPETNLFRILVCIACYPPFNMVTISLLGVSYYDPHILFNGDLAHPLTWVLRGFEAIFLLILISSGAALFTKASNLTNRGIVRWGPYAIVRHPGYLAKNLFWVTTAVPLFVPNTGAPDFSWWTYTVQATGTILGMAGWGTLYFLRAVTEEQFLMSDPDYVEYCKKVRYRFIPGVC